MTCYDATSAPLTIMWFRQDLRLEDNPALSAAAASGPVLPVYILDDANAGYWKMGGASRWWLHHSLCRLNEALGGGLWVLSGDAEAELAGLCESLAVKKVVWNRCYEPWRIRRDARIERSLQRRGIQFDAFKGALIWEPNEALKANDEPYGVFTPFYRNLLRKMPADSPLPKPCDMTLADCAQPHNRIDRLELKPGIPWDAEFHDHWTPGEQGALDQLDAFLQDGLENYKARRDYPVISGVSALSPHLHFGEISPLRVWREARMSAVDSNPDPWLRQICWREFSYHMLFHHQHMCDANLDTQFDRFPWRFDQETLRRWQRGLTGYPLVDAGMRELWRTGTMHNRVRMVTASFLTKNLMIHWREGARWFWDCLMDADLANNSFGWQWVAGCGADAAPYFRIFNPITQSQKFDPEGGYLRRWLPELRRLSNRHIHAPWQANANDLAEAGVYLNQSYPAPMIDLGSSREQALEAWRALRNR